MLQKIAGKVQCDKHNQMLHSSDVGRMEVSTMGTSDSTIRHSKYQRGSPVWRSTLEKSQLHGYVEINEDKQEGRHRRKAIHVFSVWQGLYPITTASAGQWEDPHRWKVVHMRSVWQGLYPKTRDSQTWENSHGRKAIHMCYMWKGLYPKRHPAETWEDHKRHWRKAIHVHSVW